MLRVLGLWCLTSLSTIFQYIVAVSFIGGENRSTRRRPQTLSHNVVSSISRLSGTRTHYGSKSCLKTIDSFIESALYDVHMVKSYRPPQKTLFKVLLELSSAIKRKLLTCNNVQVKCDGRVYINNSWRPMEGHRSVMLT